jgi:hypothetical protein
MNPWTDSIQNTHEEGEPQSRPPAELPTEARFFGVDSALRRVRHQLDGESHQAKMRTDLRMLALAGFIPERGYKKAHAFHDAVELMRELARNAR